MTRKPATISTAT